MRVLRTIYDSDVSSRIVEFVIGLMFLISGLIHLSGPYFFLEAALRYELFGVDVLIWVLPILAAAQLVIATALLVGFAPRVCLVISGIMFSVFAVAQLSIIFRGISASCGCFGSVSSQVGLFSVAKLLALLVLCFAFALRTPNSNIEAGGASREFS